MRTGLTIPLVLLCAFLSYAQRDNLFSTYKIPTYSFYELHVAGQDFLTYFRNKIDEDHNDAETVTIDLALGGRYLKQSPLYNGDISGYLSYYYDKSKRSEISSYSGMTPVYGDVINERSVSDVYLNSFNDFYLRDEKGLFLFGDLKGAYHFFTPSKTGYSTIEFSSGIGYGRIVNLKSVVQAYIIGRESGIDLSEEAISKLTEIIEKRRDGYYSKNRDNADIEFYREIDSVVKKPEMTAKIQQVFNSALYQTAERRSGLKFKLGSRYTNEDGENSDTKYQNLVDIAASVEYAAPIGFDKQFYISVSYLNNTNSLKGKAPMLSVSSSFSIDHSYTWSSSINAKLISVFPENEAQRSNYSISLTSNYVLLNALSVFGSLEYSNTIFYNWGSLSEIAAYSYHPEYSKTQLHLGVKYYIL